MKKSLISTLAVLLVLLAASSVIAGLEAIVPDRPNFVWSKMVNFGSQLDSRYAWARMFGWGRGVYVSESGEIPFTWFAWSNSDGGLKVDISLRLSDQDLAKFDAVKKDEMLLEAGIDKRDNSTWVEPTHVWFMRHCKNYSADEPGCDPDAALQEVIGMIGEVPFIKGMEVVEHLK